MQAPQSRAQLVQVSPLPVSHTPLPHVTHAPQSPGHVMQFSPRAASQFVSPQTWHMPQSIGHVVHVSVVLQRRSPQNGAGASWPMSTGGTLVSVPTSRNPALA